MSAEQPPTNPPPEGPAVPQPDIRPRPGAGTPLVPGAPGSVTPGIGARKVNLFFGLSGLLIGLAIIVVVILVGILIVAALGRH